MSLKFDWLLCGHTEQPVKFQTNPIAETILFSLKMHIIFNDFTMRFQLHDIDYLVPRHQANHVMGH